MSYDFSFDKKSVFFILAGSFAIGLLLFFAGFIVGWDRGEYSARLEMKDGDGAKTAQNQPASANQKPQTAAVVAPSAQTKPSTGAQAAPEKQAAAAPAVPDKAASSTAEAKGDKPSSAAAADPKQEKPSAATPKAEEAGTQAAAGKPPASQPPASAAGPEDSLPDPATFSLQIGAFQDEHNAAHFRDDLKTRGYPAFVFHTLDAGGRMWHTVRVGHYPDAKKASDAAAAFAGKEKIPVYVRPGNVL